MTRDPQKVAFNIGNCVVSTFLAGVVYLAFAPPHPTFVQTVLPAFAATAVDFLATTVVLAGVSPSRASAAPGASGARTTSGVCRAT